MRTNIYIATSRVHKKENTAEAMNVTLAMRHL